MLDVLNHHAHGFIAVPTILACRELGLFPALAEGPKSSERLTSELRLNGGHTEVALRLLETIQWLRQGNGAWHLQVQLTEIDKVPEDILQWWSFPFSEFLNGRDGRSLSEWIARCQNHWGVASSHVAEMLDGAFVVPLLTQLQRGGVTLREGQLRRDGQRLPGQAEEELIAVFQHFGWVDQQGIETDLGQFLLNRGMIVAALFAYVPMLLQLKTLLAGDPSDVFQRDASGHESHVERTLNVQASGFQHEKYFSDVDDILREIFSGGPEVAPPRFVADTGCGDGALLKRIAQSIQQAGGASTAETSVKLVGVDYNQRALQATRENLADLDTEHLSHSVLQGDIGDPERLAKDLEQLGIADPGEVLHVRSFLDHDRPFLRPCDQAAAIRRAALPYSTLSVGEQGQRIPPGEAVQSLVEHLQRWAAIVNSHGMIVLEVHSVPPEYAHRYRDECESLHFDAYHGFSRQHLVEADTFLLSAAETGLFAKTSHFRRYPKTLPYCRITLSWLEPRCYSIHPYAVLDPPLQDEARQWLGDSSSLSADELLRIADHDPFGFYVACRKGNVIGVAIAARVARPTPHGGATELAECLHQLSDDGDCIALCHCQTTEGFSREEFVQFISHHSRLKPGINDFITPSLSPDDTAQLAEPAAEVATEPAKEAGEEIGEKIGDGAVDVNDLVRSTIEVLMDESPNTFDQDKTLYELGLDSLDHMELAATLSKELAIELDASLLYQCETPAKLAKQLGKRTRRGRRGSIFSMFGRGTK